MARINENFQKLQAGYLFPEIGRRVRAFTEANPDADVIKLGIGDVTLPLVPAVVEAMHQAVDELGTEAGFRGYGPENGYDFLLDAIREHDYRARGVEIEGSEIFVSDGSKQDSGNIQEIFGSDCSLAVTDPVYPVYIDTNVMVGRTGPVDARGYYEGVVYLPCTAENDFTPALPDQPVDLIYLCSPNNPTGTVASHTELKKWVDYALAQNSVLLFDAAYEAFITDPAIPRSIYQVEGAERCAIEFRSFSKTAGFTGVRCGLTVVPEALNARTAAGDVVSLNKLWSRKGSVFGDHYHDRILRTPREVRNALAYVMHNARKHGRHVTKGLDHFCSGWWFDGWREELTIRGLDGVERPVAHARTWLLDKGWRKHRLLSLSEVPGG